MLDTAAKNPPQSLAGQDDAELLRQFVDQASDAAFKLLVVRHIDRIYATALRHVREKGLAEDVTQAVFILLAKKARSLPRNVVIVGWLHRATYLTARHANRTINRRRIHERQAAEMSQNIHLSNSVVHQESPSEELLAVLDGALAQLDPRDRDALTLRYLQAMTLEQVAGRTGITVAAATKRIQRALAKTRAILARKRIDVSDLAIPALLGAPVAHAPPELALKAIEVSLAAAHGSLAGGSAAALAKAANLALAGARSKMIAAFTVTLIAAILGSILAHWAMHGPRAQTVAIAPPPPPLVNPAPPREGPVAPDDLSYQTVPVNDPALSGFSYAPGWPRLLPGAIFSTPAVANLEGNGKLDIVVTCGPSFSHAGSETHPKPNALPLLFAIRPDGTTLPGWPIVVGTARQARPPHASPWVSSPSVFRDNDGKDRIVVRGPGGAAIYIVGADRTPLKISSGNPASSIPLADFNGDGTISFSVGKALATVKGGEVPGWPAAKKFKTGFAPCIGDALGDGKLKVYQLYYADKVTGFQSVAGYDAHGNKLPGWPLPLPSACWEPPVMGDLTGDGKMDVIVSTMQGLFAWTWDGRPLAGAGSDGPLVGMFCSDAAQMTASPSLADLDGSGKADIILFDQNLHAIRAWHGNGTGVGDEKGAATQPSIDGFVAFIPGDAYGVSVVSLGDDPRVMDFFAGSWWVRRFPDGRVVTKNMIPGIAATEFTQPTIADVEGNGKADVIFGTSDGRLYVYRTGLAYHPQRTQWPTANGNFQHTGAWKPVGTAVIGNSRGP